MTQNTAHRPLAHLSTAELLMRTALFQSMQSGLVETIGAPAINRLIRENGEAPKWLLGLTRFVMERTAIKVFFGGVGEEKNLETARDLLKRGIGTIIDNAAPETQDGLNEQEAFARALEGYKKGLSICARLREEHAGGGIAAAFKFSTVASYEDLKAISAQLESPENRGKKIGEKDLGALQEKFDAIYARAKDFFEEGHKNGIEAFADAEETDVNPAIVELSAHMMKKGLRPSLTIQAYLKDADAQAEQLLTMQPPPNIKLVRGAYLGAERQQRGKIWDTKEETDACYNRILKKLYEAKNLDTITVATHNQESRFIGEELVREAREKGNDKHPHIVFATLLGIGANLKAADPALGIEERKYQPALLDENTVAVLGAIAYFSRRAKEFMSTPDPLHDHKTRAELELEEIRKELGQRGFGGRTLSEIIGKAVGSIGPRLANPLREAFGLSG